MQVLTLPPSWKSRLDAREGGTPPVMAVSTPEPHRTSHCESPALGKPVGGAARLPARQEGCVSHPGHRPPKAGRGLTQALLQDMHWTTPRSSHRAKNTLTSPHAAAAGVNGSNSEGTRLPWIGTVPLPPPPNLKQAFTGRCPTTGTVTAARLCACALGSDWRIPGVEKARSRRPLSPSPGSRGVFV